MHPRDTAARDPDKPAIVMAGSGVTVSYGELVSRSNRIARLLRGLGLRRGDHVAHLMENHPHYYEPVWAALNSGLYFTSLSTLLKPAELAYIIRDSGTRVLFTSQAMAATVAPLAPLIPDVAIFMLDGAIDGARDLEKAIAGLDDGPLPDETQGAFMVYSSGTTGSPKGIKPAIPDLPIDQPMGILAAQLKLYEFHGETVYLSPAPLYHTAPLKWNLTVQMAGGTCIVMQKFDAAEALALIERHRVTLSHWVPTMFIRMLALPDAEKRRDLSSMVQAVHAAAPCPIEIKRRMIDWWGCIIDEYYAGSESNGLTLIRCAEWLERPGSVGRSMRGPIHIMADDGETELPPGEPGTIYFEGGTPFEYHNDPEKTAAGRNSRGWTAIGDVGYVDTEGYLFLTDRKQDMIISGGVNIYSREAEDMLAAHPKVHDVAVIGTPHADLGEEVRAVVQPVAGIAEGQALADELRAYLGERLATYKCPRAYDFVDELPRLPNGKLMKRLVRDRYWKEAGGRTTLAARMTSSNHEETEL